MKKILILLICFIHFASWAQVTEMDKFYNHYKVSQRIKKSCDSVYKLIEERRGDLSKTIKIYKEQHGTLKGFIYDWTKKEKEIIPYLKRKLPLPLKHLLYYSYFDLGYGLYGLKLNGTIAQKGLKEIEPTAGVWTMEPGLLEVAIRYAGGEEKYMSYINKVETQSKDKNLTGYIKNYLSPKRALKVGKILPLLQYRSLSDTTTIVNTSHLNGKYYLVDIWATWCAPCIEEMPALREAYQQYKNKNTDFISISLDNTPALPQNFLKTNPLPWEQGIAISLRDILNSLMINGIPCPILIDVKGKILAYGIDLRGDKLIKTLKEKLSTN